MLEILASDEDKDKRSSVPVDHDFALALVAELGPASVVQQRTGISTSTIYRDLRDKIKAAEPGKPVWIAIDKLKRYCIEAGLPYPIISARHPDEVRAFEAMRALREADRGAFDLVVAVARRYLEESSQKSAGIDYLRSVLEALSGKNR